MPPPTFIIVAEVARLLSRDVRTIHRMIERGELEAVKAHEGIRAPYLVSRGSVEALTAERSVT